MNPLQLARDRFERDLRQQIRSDAGPGSSVAWSYLHLIELAGEFPDLPADALVRRAIAWYGYAEAGRRADGGDP